MVSRPRLHIRPRPKIRRSSRSRKVRRESRFPYQRRIGSVRFVASPATLGPRGSHRPRSPWNSMLGIRCNRRHPALQSSIRMRYSYPFLLPPLALPSSGSWVVTLRRPLSTKLPSELSWREESNQLFIEDLIYKSEEKLHSSAPRNG